MNFIKSATLVRAFADGRGFELTLSFKANTGQVRFIAGVTGSAAQVLAAELLEHHGSKPLGEDELGLNFRPVPGGDVGVYIACGENLSSAFLLSKRFPQGVVEAVHDRLEAKSFLLHMQQFDQVCRAPSDVYRNFALSLKVDESVLTEGVSNKVTVNIPVGAAEEIAELAPKPKIELAVTDPVFGFGLGVRVEFKGEKYAFKLASTGAKILNQNLYSKTGEACSVLGVGNTEFSITPTHLQVEEKGRAEPWLFDVTGIIPDKLAKALQPELKVGDRVSYMGILGRVEHVFTLPQDSEPHALFITEGPTAKPQIRVCYKLTRLGAGLERAQ